MSRRAIKTLVAISVATSIIALSALGVSVYLFVHRTQQIQVSRRDSAFDTCKLLQVVILGSSREQNKLPQGRAFLRRYHLSDCRSKAKQETALP